MANPHDALDDALVTAQAFLVLASRLPVEPTVGDLARLAGGDGGLNNHSNSGYNAGGRDGDPGDAPATPDEEAYR